MWDEAIERAKYLDSLPEPKGLLFGLPISTKEHHGMVGENVSTHASFVAWINKAHGSNLLYDNLYDEGCVFYVRTTQPQTIMHLETISTIYGTTVNPFNRHLTAGGSSGGEGALLGLRGSILVNEPALYLRFIADINRALEVILVAAFVVQQHTTGFTLSSELF